MLPSRNLRRSGLSINNGRLKLLKAPGTIRNYSLHVNRSQRLVSLRPSIRQSNTCVVQTRSLSLFGWGGAPKTSNGINTTSQSTPEVDIGPTSLSNVRTVKASHETSDVPDPSIGHHPPNSFTPNLIEKAEDIVSFPTGSDTVEGVLNNSAQIPQTAEYVGYLKQVCGLDYGWGPTSVMETILEYIHISGGVGWAASIIVLASLLRISMIPSMVTAQKESQKIRDLNPVLAPLRESSSAALKEGNRTKALQIQQELRLIQKEAGIKMSRAFIPMLIQFPFQFGAFRMLSASGKLPVPGFVAENWLWTTDLSLSDPYFLTPAISAAFIYLQFKQSQKAQGPQMAAGPVSPTMMNILGKVLPGVSFIFMAFQPGAVQLYFMTSSVWAFASGSLLRQSWFRARVSLSPLPGSDGASSVLQASSNKTVKKLPGGLQRRPLTIPVADDLTNKAPEAERSVIDKGVDSVKAVGSRVVKSFKLEGNATVSKKMNERKEAAAKETAAKYALQRKQQLEIEREKRNQASKR